MRTVVIRQKDPGATTAIKRWGEGRSERARYESDWNDIARLIRPQRGGFGLDNTADRTHEKPLSSAPIRAASNFAAALYGTATNPAQRWFKLATGDPQLDGWKPMAEWLERASTIVFQSFGHSVSSFYDQMMELSNDIAAFGNAAQYDEVVPTKQKIRDVTVSLNEIVAFIDAFGAVEEIVRRTHLTPSALVTQYGMDAVPERIAELAKKGSTDTFAVYHHVVTNDAWRPGALKIGAAGKPWRSVHAMDIEGGWLLRRSGYDDMPFYFPRWSVESGQTYGTGPGFVALASARTHNQMQQSTLRAAQRAADPTLLAPDRDSWPMTGRIKPGGVLYGGVNVRGEPMVRPLDVVGNINLTLEEKQQVMQEVSDAFYHTMLNVTGRTGLTAVEAAAIEAERTRLWAPNMGRIQSEYLAKKVERRFKLLLRAHQIPMPPDPGRDGPVPLLVQYTSAAEIAQRAQDRMNTVQLIGDIAPLAQLKPRLMDRLDEDALIEHLSMVGGVSQTLLRSREDADALAQRRAEQQQAAQAMQMMQAGASAAKDMGAAQAAVQRGGA